MSGVLIVADTQRPFSIGPDHGSGWGHLHSQAWNPTRLIEVTFKNCKYVV